MLALPDHFSALTQLPEVTTAVVQQIRLLFHDQELLVSTDGCLPFSPAADYYAHNSVASLVIGQLGTHIVLATQLASPREAPPAARWAELRSLFGVMANDWLAVAALSKQLLDWDLTHRFCGTCASPTERATTERARRCKHCGHTAYPRISPAMMCLVTRGNKILLARNANFPAGRYSALAGFLEAGESIEDAIHREVMEEVGIEVGALQYFGSQSWPFPHSLMIAYTAEYKRGVLTPNGHEIADAQWFSTDNLPDLPPPLSIAGMLIAHALSSRSGRNDG